MGTTMNLALIMHGAHGPYMPQIPDLATKHLTAIDPDDHAYEAVQFLESLQDPITRSMITWGCSDARGHCLDAFIETLTPFFVDLLRRNTGGVWKREYRCCRILIFSTPEDSVKTEVVEVGLGTNTDTPSWGDPFAPRATLQVEEHYHLPFTIGNVDDPWGRHARKP